MCTSSGPLYLSAANIRLGAQEVTQHKVPRNDGTNYADYLLDGINTRSIAIDGGNRKWLGTNSMVYISSVLIAIRRYSTLHLIILRCCPILYLIF